VDKTAGRPPHAGCVHLFCVGFRAAACKYSPLTVGIKPVAGTLSWHYSDTELILWKGMQLSELRLPQCSVDIHGYSFIHAIISSGILTRCCTSLYCSRSRRGMHLLHRTLRCTLPCAHAALFLHARRTHHHSRRPQCVFLTAPRHPTAAAPHACRTYRTISHSSLPPLSNGGKYSYHAWHMLPRPSGQ